MSIKTKSDAIIIGGGPAGATCALWLKMLGFRPCLIERRASLGGLQNDSPYPNNWITPLSRMTGVEVAAAIHHQIVEHGIDCRLGEAAGNVEKAGQGFAVTTERGAIVSGNLLVLASGFGRIEGRARRHYRPGCCGRLKKL